MRDNRLLLARAGQAAEEHRFFFAHALAIFARSRDMDGSGVTSWLGCDEANHVKLQLCRLPDGDSPSFKEDLTAISEFTGISAAKLAMVVREAEAAEAMFDGTAASQDSMLLAARDREFDASDAGQDRPDRVDHDGEDQTSS